MDDFARLRSIDRADLFRTVAAQRGVNAAIIEKDFWVCWTLRRIFSLPNPPAQLLFKGGTSLSKVFKAIERFSEDLDLSFNRSGLGFAGEADPLLAATRKKREKGLEALTEACCRVIQQEFLPQLRLAFGQALNRTAGDGWSIELARDDPQTIVFHYPAAIEARPGHQPAYIQPAVRLELGARSEHWPTVEATVVPYAAEDAPNLFAAPSCAVRVLSAERTFWEKATILHTWYHAPAEKILRERQSRHYYDVVRMYEHGVGREAIKDTGLLLSVARHKEVFFPAAWANYAEARPGTLRLVPPGRRLEQLRQDYASTREMIFGPLPTFDHLLEVLKEIEETVNTSSE